jgi:predicted transcriptional regulator
VAARAVRQIIDRFCQGSVEELVSGMVDANVLSRNEMDRLEAFVRSRRRGGK